MMFLLYGKPYGCKATGEETGFGRNEEGCRATN